MVRALLAGTKTQTRRVVKPQPEYDADMLGGVYMFTPPKGVGSNTAFAYAKDPAKSSLLLATCPYGQPGSRLWVRETLFWSAHEDSWCYQAGNDQLMIEPTARILLTPKPAIPSIHMPREASRLLLEVVSVRVERLQDIGAHDALAEGVEYQYRNDCPPDERAITAYKELWASINGPDSWDANPWVWCMEFKRLPPTTT